MAGFIRHRNMKYKVLKFVMETNALTGPATRIHFSRKGCIIPELDLVYYLIYNSLNKEPIDGVKEDINTFLAAFNTLEVHDRSFRARVITVVDEDGIFEDFIQSWEELYRKHRK